VSHRNQWDTGE